MAQAGVARGGHDTRCEVWARSGGLRRRCASGDMGNSVD